MRKLYLFIFILFNAEVTFALKKVTHYEEADNTIKVLSSRFGYITTKYSGIGIGEHGFTEFFFGPLSYKTDEVVSDETIIITFSLIIIIGLITTLILARKYKKITAI
ncbi:MAG: hypothetical protein NE328_08250 [Lentisphaeraceae bacterium]|nr:hypothetical protein [Lentisphaeraceae bacterium]